jgi:hypothetical protein
MGESEFYAAIAFNKLSEHLCNNCENYSLGCRKSYKQFYTCDCWKQGRTISEDMEKLSRQINDLLKKLNDQNGRAFPL